MTDFLDLVALCERQLRMSGVNDSERVAVLSHADERAEYADAFLAATRRLGAQAFHVRLPGGHSGPGLDQLQVGATPLSGNDAAVEALKNSDLLIDLMFLLFTPEQFAIQNSGTRILSVVEPVSLLTKMFPTEHQRERITHGVKMLEAASQLRVTSEAGTDITYELNTYPVVGEYGFNDRPGAWDHWPSGFLFTGGDDTGVNGRVVIRSGDVIFPFNAFVRSPIEVTVEQGRVVDIRGDWDATLLREYMASFNDPDAYGISHIGWGMNENAVRTAYAVNSAGIGMEPRAVYGNVLFSTGPNAELGGSNHTPCHVDIPLFGCDLVLDDIPVVQAGDILVPELKAAGR